MRPIMYIETVDSRVIIYIFFIVCPTVGKEAVLQVFEQEGDGKHLLSVGKYGAWNILRSDQVHAEKWMVSPWMFWICMFNVFDQCSTYI